MALMYTVRYLAQVGCLYTCVQGKGHEVRPTFPPWNIEATSIKNMQQKCMSSTEIIVLDMLYCNWTYIIE